VAMLVLSTREPLLDIHVYFPPLASNKQKK
jgi:hypothetical protein